MNDYRKKCLALYKKYGEIPPARFVRFLSAEPPVVTEGDLAWAREQVVEILEALQRGKA
jgi:hypothetical protein